MTRFPVHTIDSAPEPSRPSLAAAREKYGTIPNLLGVFAGSPAALGGYLAIGDAFGGSSFDATEQQIVLLTTSFENDCSYCVAAHSAIANMSKVPSDVVEALRSGAPLAAPKHEALRRFTRLVVENQGWVPEVDVDAFLESGYTEQHVLEVVLGVAMKVLSNFTNHLAETPLDAGFQPFAWSKPAEQTA